MKKRIFALTLALCLCITLLPMTALAADEVAIDETNFPDEYFREYVSEEFDTDGDGVLSASECDAVSKVRVNFCDILSLKGIEYFTKLVELRCSDNSITSLDLSKNTELRHLNCSGNKLTELDVSKNTALEKFACDNNKLTTIDVSKNTALKELLCGFNSISALNVSNNIALESLLCPGNKLTALDVSKNTALKFLDCNTNNIRELDISKNAQLVELWCQYNNISMLDVSKNTKLSKLYCYMNSIRELDLSNNLALTDLICYFNKLTALDVSKNTELESLSCSDNSIAALDLSNNKKLENMWCVLSVQTIELKVPLNGFDLGALIGPENLSRITSVTGGTLNNGIISCSGNEFDYYYDTKSDIGDMQVMMINTPCPQAKFTDAVPENHWAHESIDYVLDRGIMSGTSDTTFEPNGTVTRAMVAVMLFNLSGDIEVDIPNPFSDVPKGAWYESSVLWAYNNDIVSGYGDGTFNPNGAVTREQLAIMMQNYAAYMGKNSSASYDLSKFSDSAKISSWASDSVEWACAVGLISGSDEGGKLYMNPQGNATRAQIAVIFQNFCETFRI